jgi:hypothetical protein
MFPNTKTGISPGSTLVDIAPLDRPKVKAECLRLLVTLKLNPAKVQLISGFIDTDLKLN